MDARTNQPSGSPALAARGVPLFDGKRQYEALRGEIDACVARVLASGQYILGSDCQELERALADYCQASHAIACASGSDALLLALMAYDVGPGDEVILPSFTFFATASAVARLGAKPVFVDLDENTWCLDPDLVARAVTRATKAILPVHLYGQCAEMEPLAKIASTHGLALIEDAAQAIGAEYQGRRAGSLGDIGCFSFYPTKNLGACGDAGLLTTNRADLADKLLLLRAHGMRPRYYHQLLGINSRLDALQAAILNVKLRYLDGWTERRQTLARQYTRMFLECGLDQMLSLPVEAQQRRHVWNQYVVRVPLDQRDALREHLAQERIGSEIYYPVPLHQQACFAHLGLGEKSLPKTEQAAREVLALPIYPELTDVEQQQVVAAMAGFFGRSPRERGSIPRPKFLDRANQRQRAD